jgi:hypothetical protein
MQNRFVKTVAAAAFGVCLIAGTASAQGKGHDKDKGDDKHHDADPHHVADPRHAPDPHHVADQHHVADEHHTITTYHKVPPGLAKKGGLPPGQAKKYYHPAQGVPVVREVFLHHGYTVVRTQPYGTSEYVYYRQANGPVQRAVILPGPSQLSFQNVPASLVQEILARLY